MFKQIKNKLSKVFTGYTEISDISEVNQKMFYGNKEMLVNIIVGGQIISFVMTCRKRVEKTIRQIQKSYIKQHECDVSGLATRPYRMWYSSQFNILTFKVANHATTEDVRALISAIVEFLDEDTFNLMLDTLSQVGMEYRTLDTKSLNNVIEKERAHTGELYRTRIDFVHDSKVLCTGYYNYLGNDSIYPITLRMFAMLGDASNSDLETTSHSRMIVDARYHDIIQDFWKSIKNTDIVEYGRNEVLPRVHFTETSAPLGNQYRIKQYYSGTFNYA